MKEHVALTGLRAVQPLAVAALQHRASGRPVSQCTLVSPDSGSSRGDASPTACACLCSALRSAVTLRPAARPPARVKAARPCAVPHPRTRPARRPAAPAAPRAGRTRLPGIRAAPARRRRMATPAVPVAALCPAARPSHGLRAVDAPRVLPPGCAPRCARARPSGLRQAVPVAGEPEGRWLLQ
nr:transcriptional regulatory protein AlgP [Aegilops tauschii subsp. strangulata]